MYYTIFRDTAGQWRWRFTAANHKIIAMSSESYWNKQDCLGSIALVKGSALSPIYEG